MWGAMPGNRQVTNQSSGVQLKPNNGTPENQLGNKRPGLLAQVVLADGTKFGSLEGGRGRGADPQQNPFGSFESFGSCGSVRAHRSMRLMNWSWSTTHQNAA